MRDLVQKLPSGNPQHDHGTSDDTIAAVLATLNEVIKKHPEFSRSLLEAGGVERLMTITRQRSRFTSRVVKFASQVLYSMWVHQELREVYRKAGWKEQDFVTKTIAARNARPNSPTNMNSTLNRPMASQSGTRYEDRTIRRSAAGGSSGGAGSGSVPVVGGNGDAHGKNSYLVEYRVRFKLKDGRKGLWFLWRVFDGFSRRMYLWRISRFMDERGIRKLNNPFTLLIIM